MFDFWHRYFQGRHPSKVLLLYKIFLKNVTPSIRGFIVQSDKFECEVMDWALFEKLARRVAEKIKTSEFKPDFIVGLARGGWVLARVLCDLLGVKDLVSLKVEHWGVTATPDGKAALRYPFRIDLSGRNVLIVDDITDTGESMRIATDYVKTLSPREVRTAALRNIVGSKFVPDFYGDEINWRWVVFPWNYTEDMCNIVDRVASKWSDPSDVKRVLKSDYKIDVDEDEINEIIEELKRRSRA